MAIKELFYDQRPVALLNPRASQRIDPRFKFSRSTLATYVDSQGLLRRAPAGEPRFTHNPETKEPLGFLVEPAGTNYLERPEEIDHPFWFKDRLTINANAGVAPDGTSTADLIIPTTENNSHRFYRITAGLSGDCCLSFFAKAAGYSRLTINTGVPQNWPLAANVYLDSEIIDGNQGTLEKYSNGWYRVRLRISNATASSSTIFSLRNNSGSTGATTFPGDGTSGIYVWGVQLEQVAEPTSYIPTSGAAGTRGADLLSIDSVSIPAAGSIYTDAQSLTTGANDTLLSLKNASNQKLNLAMEERSELYNSLALTYSVQGTVKPTLPYPVPTTNRERNIITWGTNNYQYTSDSSRYAPSLSSSVPANLTQLSIGHDAVDPTKAFNGYINAVYLYNGEITPTVAEALVRGELDPVNADTYSPVGPTGSLALIINTQGASSSGDKVFALPAESALNDNDIVITWGDGTESGLDGAAAELGAPGLSHTYPSAGIYPVWVEGQLENLKFNNSASAPDLVKIEKWGTTTGGNDVFLSPSTMNSAFYGCSKLTSMPTSGLPDTSAVTDWYRAFRGCSSLTGTFPSFNFSAATNFKETFYGCSGLTSFPAVGDQTQNVNNFQGSWYDCSSLTNFPLINTSSATNFAEAWNGCSGLQSFPLISTANATTLYRAWAGCSALDNIANAGEATSFPLINTSNCSNFQEAWGNCSSMTSFPLINTSSATNLRYAWYNCSSLTSFPALQNTNLVTNVSAAWQYTYALTSFPVIDFSAVTEFQYAWFNSGIQTFPASASGMDVSAGINFGRTWRGTSITDFPLLNFTDVGGSASDDPNGYTGFRDAWAQSTVQNFPANSFNNCQTTRYLDAFTGCALTAQSIENILVSINTAATTYNLNNGNLGIGGGTNAAKTTWSTAANNAYDALVARGWTITYNA